MATTAVALLYVLVVGLGLLLLLGDVQAVADSVQRSIRFSTLGDLCADSLVAQTQFSVDPTASYLGLTMSPPLRLELFDPASPDAALVAVLAIGTDGDDEIELAGWGRSEFDLALSVVVSDHAKLGRWATAYGAQQPFEMGERSYFLVFVPTVREIRDFYREK
eukprot:SAG31_NODE_8665_length_1410_cov_3.434020_1_plen_163_part_00